MFESEVARIGDVLAVRASEQSELGAEIHVLAAPGRSPEDISSDIRSLALLRGVPLHPGGIHIVQLQPLLGEGAEVPVTAAKPEAVLEEPAAPDARIAIDGVVVITSEGSARAVTTVRLGARTSTGTAVFVPTSVSMRRGVAEATLTAVLEARASTDDMAVDDALLLPVPPNEVALVTLALAGPAGEETLVGAALVRSGGANDAIARAVLDATNRWFTPTKRRAP